jgi:hypothetical protein
MEVEAVTTRKEELYVSAGESIDRVCSRACAAAKLSGQAVPFTFNDTTVVAYPDSSPRDLFRIVLLTRELNRHGIKLDT